MKEKDFINNIKAILNSSYIGDDCAYLKELNITVTQDSLVEDVHFSRNFATPYQIGFKSVAVNISDICASGAEPKYLTVALSIPKSTDNKFIEEFYKGAKAAANGAEIVGGDITGADKIYISVCAIGTTNGRKISSRACAKIGQKIVISGLHGSSGAGLNILSGKYPKTLFNSRERERLIEAHLMPKVQYDFSKQIALSQKSDYAMMDTSDGLADALYSISDASDVLMEIDIDKIPHDKAIEKIGNYENLILYGGEDYGLIGTADEPENFTVIGEVKKGNGLKINYPNHNSKIITKKELENNLYNHFKE